jgi:type III secretion protein D
MELTGKDLKTMKQLRILTGQHAGVQLDLSSARYVISADDKADIQLLDWTSDTMILLAAQDGSISMAMVSAGASEPQADAFEQVEDFVPRRVGDIVLCIGDAAQTWPSDIDLIARLTQPAAPAEAPPPQRRRVVSLAVGALLLLAGSGAVMARLAQSSPPTADAAQTVASRNRAAELLKLRVERAIAGIPAPGLQVVQSGDSVTVAGLLDDTADVQALRQRLATFASERVIQSYASAGQISQTIADSLAQPGLNVRYQGHGVFLVSAQVANVERLRDNIDRVAVDLAPLVRRIELDATELPNAGHVPTMALLNSQGLQYVQTRDGVKHLSVSPAPDTEAIDPLAAASR